MSRITSIAPRRTATAVTVRSRTPGASASQSNAGSAQLEFVRDPLRLLLFALTLFNVSRLQEAIPVLGHARPGLTLVALAGLFAYLNPKALTQTNIFAFWPPRRVLVLGGLACASAVFGLSLGGSASFILQNYAKTILACFLLAWGVRTASDLYTIVWSYAISCGILAYFSIFVFRLTNVASLAYRLDDLYTYDANDLCVVLIVGLASVLLLLQVSKGWSRLVLLMILVGIAASFARSGSRGGFLGLLAFGAAAMVLVNSVSAGRRLALVFAACVGMAAFAPPGYWDQMRTILKPKNDYNYDDPNGRRELAKRGMKYMLTYPAFGVGIANFQRAECNISGEKIGGGGLRCAEPHNSYVQAGSELGIPGLLVWVSIVIGGIYSLLRLRARLPRSWRRGNPTEQLLYSATHYFALGLIGFAVTAFFVSFAWLDTLYILVAFITGLYLAVRAYRVQQMNPEAAAAGPAAPLITRNTPGWRVLASMQRTMYSRQSNA